MIFLGSSLELVTLEVKNVSIPNSIFFRFDENHRRVTHNDEDRAHKNSTMTPTKSVDSQAACISGKLTMLWVDATIDEQEEGCQQTLEALRTITNNLYLFCENNGATKFLKDSCKDGAIVVSSGALGSSLVPRIHAMEQVESIYIFCGSPERHEPWAREWPKVKGVYNTIMPICQSIRQSMEQVDNEDGCISFLKELNDGSNVNLAQLEPSFMYTKLFKNVLINMDRSQMSHEDLVRYCNQKYRENVEQSEIVKEFDRDYQPQLVIYWYTRECFTYCLLNDALRWLQSDVIVIMGFFIHDLHRRLKHLHKEQIHGFGNKPFLLFRGQRLSESSRRKLYDCRGGLMSFNNFLSTSARQSIAKDFVLEQDIKGTNNVRMLFVMTIDPQLKSAIFADITEDGYYGGKESEILFCMNTVFRIGNMRLLDEDQRLYEVQLKLTADDDTELAALSAQIEKEIRGDTAWKRLGKLLIKLGQWKKAEELYQTLLQQARRLEDEAHYLFQLGWIKDDQGHPKEAVQYYKQALDIEEKIFSSKDPSLATSYHNIGLAYANMGENETALFYYRKALSIEENNKSSSDDSLAVSYNNIGNVYLNLENYSKALEYFERTVSIEENHLDKNNPSLGTSYNNLGAVHQKMGTYAKALFYYKKALTIKQKSLPSDHLSLATSYSNIGWIHQQMKNYPEALSHYKKAHAIQKMKLPKDHPERLELEKVIEVLQNNA